MNINVLALFSKWIRKMLIWVFIFTIPLFIYILAVVICSWIPVNTDFKNLTEDSVEIYVLSNGVHTDLVFPIHHPFYAWEGEFPRDLTKSKSKNAKYISFGWGDKGFYLETETWAELTFSIAFKAMFYLGETAMHVSYYTQLKEGNHCKKVSISREMYTILIQHVRSSFKKNSKNLPIQIPEASYGENDVFYEGVGTYGMFHTCNTWTNKGLKDAHLPAALWTPLDKGILIHY